ncbi:hypothetical protein FHW69_003799 [Luteibacter sp. Sphag1AF]|uniref:hypothetical protein n=1 Tax=Luteibacter sp. Sphag1AF TaxID=2587031 RepID=UPI001613F9C9|nr:hypothetical protein [Luteibacter sp. Sphag1AF]MBB3229147.1 hypothetical protein [Luteibacter sp. Sphag1AF]
MTTFKAALALAGFALAVYVGLRVAGLLTLFLLHATHVPWEWHTYWVYFALRDHPAMAPHAGTIKAAGIVGFGMPLALWTGAVAKFLKPVARSAHGEARFAQRRDLFREVLLRAEDTGIVIGKSRNDFIPLTRLEDPSNKFSNARHEPVLASSRTC